LITLTLLAALISGLRWYSRRRKQRREAKELFSNLAPSPVASIRRVPRYSTEEQARQLFEAIYSLAEGNPGQWVACREAVERAGIPFTTRDYDSLFRHLKQAGLITTDNLILNEVCKLTPKGARVIERVGDLND
jgi:predicted transcriptional regulator